MNEIKLKRFCIQYGFLCAASWLLASSAAAELTAAQARTDYDRLIEWRVGAPRAVPEGGLEWTRDTASWTLESGSLRAHTPTSDGMVTGWVFEGRGRFQMAVPDGLEAVQLERISEQPGMRAVDEVFTRAVLRTSDGGLGELLGVASSNEHFEGSLFQQRHERWLNRSFNDVDARILAGRLIPGDRFLRIEMDTDSLGWLVFEEDGLRREEVRLTRSHPSGANEIWVSLDRAEDRLSSGRPSGARRALLQVPHLDLRIDLTGKRRATTIGPSHAGRVEAQISADLRLIPRVDALRALPLRLSPWAKVESVRDAEGRELAFLRNHIGGRTVDVDKDLYDDSLVVLLPEAVAAGEEQRLSVSYTLLALNYFPGRAWYPGLSDHLDDLHTARLEIKLDKGFQARAIGRRLEERAEGKKTVSVWEVEKPTKMVSLTYGKRFKEEVLEVDGAPRVISFGPQISRGFSGNMIRNVGADVVNSVRFFSSLFDYPLPVDTLQVTGIAAGHGQAFEGFLHMSEITYASENPGASEAFRAHETAHQWWGHLVGWHCYRDQWLSESIAEYVAMMYVRESMKKGERHFEEMLQMYTHLMLGSLKGSFSKYARPFLNDLDLSHRRRLGPIGMGYRASTTDMPAGYQMQVYYKGPLVLHMLRSVLTAVTRDEDLFVRILREFVREWAGKAPRTEDFVATVNRLAPGDWGWFFDQWIDGTEIPKYSYSYQVPRAPNAEGQWVVELEVRQANVSPGFSMPVPVAIEMAGGGKGTYIAQVSQPSNRFTIPLPKKPTKLELAPDFSVLAEIKKR